MNASSRPGIVYPVIIGLLIVALNVAMFLRVGIAPIVIIGGSAVISFVVWMLTTYRRPADPDKVVALYYVAVAFQILHTAEEYLADFPGEFTLLFNQQIFTRDSFAFSVMGVAAAMWVLAGVGVMQRNPAGNYLMWFFLIGPGLVNAIAHLSFPLIAGQPYFPGLVTVLLPTIPTIIVVRRLLAGSDRAA